MILLFGVEQGANVLGQLPVPGFGGLTGLRIELADSLPELIGQSQFPAQERHELVHSNPLLQALAHLARQAVRRRAGGFELLPAGGVTGCGGGFLTLHLDRLRSQWVPGWG